MSNTDYTDIYKLEKEYAKLHSNIIKLEQLLKETETPNGFTTVFNRNEMIDNRFYRKYRKPKFGTYGISINQTPITQNNLDSIMYAKARRKNLISLLSTFRKEKEVNEKIRGEIITYIRPNVPHNPSNIVSEPTIIQRKGNRKGRYKLTPENIAIKSYTQFTKFKSKL